MSDHTVNITVNRVERTVTINVDQVSGPKGEPFEYEDFTPQQIEALKVKGDPFVYGDFTPGQLEALKVKGDQGEQGVPVKTQNFTLTALDIRLGYVSLSLPVIIDQSVQVFIEDAGILAEVGIDYSLSGQEIYWLGYSLQNILETGDKLRILFY
jgi:hypothetical protein